MDIPVRHNRQRNHAAAADPVLGSVRGQAAIALDLTAAASEQATAEVAEAMARVITADRFPSLHTVLVPGGPGEYGPSGELLVDPKFGLRLLVDGVEECMRGRVG